MEFEDDVMYADISKQLCLLIMDEDDENPVAVCSSLAFQDVSRGGFQAAKAGTAAPSLDMSGRGLERKGTGVFIPRSWQPKTKQPRGRGRLSRQQRESNITVSPTGSYPKRHHRGAN